MQEVCCLLRPHRLFSVLNIYIPLTCPLSKHSLLGSCLGHAKKIMTATNRTDIFQNWVQKHPQTDLWILHSQEQHHWTVAFCCFLSVKPHSEENFFLCVRAESSKLPLLPSQTTCYYSCRYESCYTGSISFMNNIVTRNIKWGTRPKRWTFGGLFLDNDTGLQCFSLVM